MSESVKEIYGATDLAMTFIEITRSVTQGVETLEIFTTLAEKCVALLPVSAAGILLRDVNGDLQVIGASSPSAHLLDLFQVQNEEGPCLQCCNTGKPIYDHVVGTVGNWDKFAEITRSHGFCSVYALPLHSRNLAVGAVNLFSNAALSEEKLLIAQALADAATLSLLQIDPEIDMQIVVRRIHMAVQSRSLLEQAQGMIAQRFSVDAETALIKIRNASKETELAIVEVARAIVERDSSSVIHKILSKV